MGEDTARLNPTTRQGSRILEEDTRVRDTRSASTLAEKEPNRPDPLPVIRVHGVALHAISESRCVQWVVDALEVGRGGWVVTANLDHLRRLVGDAEYTSRCRDATLVVADGMPLIWASKLQGTPLPERVAGSNLISSLSAAAADRGRSIYLLGGATGTAEAAAGVLSKRHPKLRVCGTCCPTIDDIENGADSVAAITDDLRQSNPDIVYVALGSPKQEVLIDRLRDQLPGTWWLGVGNSFSFLCGHVHRAPLWVQRTGFEWLHRLIQEPRRLGRRYLVDGCPFAVRVLFGAAIQRLKSG